MSIYKPYTQKYKGCSGKQTFPLCVGTSAKQEVYCQVLPPEEQDEGIETLQQAAPVEGSPWHWSRYIPPKGFVNTKEIPPIPITDKDRRQVKVSSPSAQSCPIQMKEFPKEKEVPKEEILSRILSFRARNPRPIPKRLPTAEELLQRFRGEMQKAEAI
jgi:hypothetical protein